MWFEMWFEMWFAPSGVGANPELKLFTPFRLCVAWRPEILIIYGIEITRVSLIGFRRYAFTFQENSDTVRPR